jgi:microcystin-dependent protein
LQSGQGPGLSLYDTGQEGGTETVTLLESEMPVHIHQLQASPDPGDNTVPGPNVSLAGSIGGSVYVGGNPPLTPAAPTALTLAGGSLPHNNMQPYLTLFFCIALQGIFPQRP